MPADQVNRLDPRPRRVAGWGRWFRFGLRTLMVLVAFCAVLAGWWRDRSDLRRRLDQSELLRRSMLPPSDERSDLERSLLRELRISESLETGFPDPHAVPLLYPPDTPNILWTSESHTLEELQEIIIDRGRRADDRCAAVASLAARQAKDASALLTAALEFDGPSIRRQAAFAIARLGIKAPQAVELLQREMSASATPAAAYAGRMLWNIEPSLDLVPRFKELLKAEDSETRRWAAYALAFGGNANAEQVMPELTEMLKDSDLLLRKSAAYAIMNVASKDRALATLAQTATDETEYDMQSYLRRTIQLIQVGHERRQPEEIMAADGPEIIHGHPPFTPPRPPPVSYYRPGPGPLPPVPPKE